MIELHSLSGEPRKVSERVGRGISAGRGKTAGRGTKGQKSRSGYNLPRRFEGGQIALIQRMPKVRGFKHHSVKPIALDVALINKHFEDNETVSIKTIMQKGLIKDYPKAGVKIIGSAKLEKNLNFQGIIFSQKIEEQVVAFEKTEKQTKPEIKEPKPEKPAAKKTPAKK
jgi:large subunit ribosomal protein L15